VLANVFVKEYAGRLMKPIQGITPEAMEAILRYFWPGNIRELENAIQRAIIMTEGESIQPGNLPKEVLQDTGAKPSAIGDPSAVTPTLDLSLPMAAQIEKIVEQTERILIEQALQQSSGRQEAADRLGISRKSLHNKMRRYNMQDSE
jgi:two-component system response regulator HydG